jgi:hypothetical protein
MIDLEKELKILINRVDEIHASLCDIVQANDANWKRIGEKIEELEKKLDEL